MAMFTRSPALPASRPSALIDPHLPAEYPILLGDALKDSGTHVPVSLSMRYNWKAQKPSSISRMRVEKSEDSYDLTVEDRLHKDSPYKYTGRILGDSVTGKDDAEQDPHAQNKSLALIWDPAKSAFVLEPISASLDFNLTSAPDQSQREINAQKKLPVSGSKDVDTDARNLAADPSDSASDSDPDASNPYDFRHFLAEARVNAAKTPLPGSRTPIPGSRTPVAGSRTPLPAQSSPALGAKVSTPRFHATSSPSASAATATKKRKVERPAQSAKAQSQSQAQAQKPKPKRPAELPPSRLPASSSNHRAAHPTLNSPHGESSPHLIVSDMDAELEIDLGSPPPVERFTQRKRPAVNPDAFGHRRMPRVQESREEEGEGGGDGDIEMPDADVEELELGSPRSKSARGSMSGQQGRIEIEREEEEDDDDDGLAAELEAALEEEAADDVDEVGGLGLGLGITGTAAGKEEDESEVSEEE